MTYFLRLTTLFIFACFTLPVSFAQSHILTQDVPSLAPMLKTAMPAVVNLSIDGTLPSPIALLNPHLKPNQAPQSNHFRAQGSGVIIEAKQGYIITNAHVVKNADTVTVTLDDGHKYKAKVIGLDKPSDVAVLQINAPHLHALKIGDSSQLNVGDFVVAIGNPFGLTQSVTSGVVSALKRSALKLLGGKRSFENFIQTDAPINPGNSGGALVNMAGELVGINTAIVAPEGTNIGIGFAIPINMAHSVAQQLIEFGDVRRGMIGIYVQTLTPQLASAFKLHDKKGAVVTQIAPDSPAARGGIRVGDLVTAINATPVSTAEAISNATGILRVGSKVSITFLRDGKKHTVTTHTVDPHHATATKVLPLLSGLQLGNANEQLPTHGHREGVKVLAVTPPSPGWEAGLRPGDMIITANQTPIKNIDELQTIAQHSPATLLLHVLRGNGSLFVVVEDRH